MTPNIAMRLARYFCTRESYWLTLQAGYELELEKDLVRDQVEKEVMALDDAVRHMAEAEKTIKIPAYRAPKGDRMLREAERCDLCSGSLEPGKTKLEFWLGEQLVVVQDMPADVCRRCGEAYLSYINSASLDRLRSKSDKPEPEQFLSVPVYSAQRLLGTKSQA